MSNKGDQYIDQYIVLFAPLLLSVLHLS